ncbi:TonB-dependent Fe(3+) dicitrate receptor FecA [Pseudomonas psychrophila]|uniref:Fe(3+) dicitrate transport protein n=1 Tax=Pseudomonas psychrophila TaxID=122355 RepID=A0ABY0W9P9_9PSED|nr:TonB-dependent Fe(3+) dicitrate receptor FecA [Pseudomonas psychrophila]KAB0490384.1 TonB-dependent receptor family protein [Pseudomonas psychrophila]KMN01348.1 transporter [Pseudomonas psychrophila]QIE34853.1 TonB-dependent receptor family protein [Pseudomonas psychrophila]WVI96956.1 TonB-dependent Fe(3+) dicitrate receptor FecA [Pseudomonas psychrophila]SDU74389.1 Fe(3+) dicitrate transport protein [Pseudomonas psychrophila]
MSAQPLRLTSLARLLLGASLSFSAAAFADAKAYHIAPASLENALNQFGREAGVLISFSSATASGIQSKGLEGTYEPEQGLQALLEGTGLQARAEGQGAFSLQPVTASTAPASIELGTSSVVGDWLGEAAQADVFEHPGARDVIRREEFERQGATTAREVLNRIPGVNAPENNGTGSHDMALNFGIRGLNPRLATRSTVLMDGIPVPFAPYGQPQLSFAPISMGNMDAVDVVRGGGAVRYGPQNVGGIVNFVTRAIPDEPTVKAGFQTETSPSSTQDGFKKTANLLAGGTADNGLGGALLYSGTRGGDWREHSDTRIDDLILKGNYQIDEANSLHAMAQYYDGEADMPGGLSTAAYKADPYQSTRPNDKFWGRRTLVNFGYRYQEDRREFTVNSFFTKTLRSGYLDQGTFLSLSPREYWVRGVETRIAQGFDLGNTSHEVGAGYRYINEAGHELRYRTPISANELPTSNSRNDRDTRGATEAHAFFIDDKIDIGKWTLTPGIRYEMIEQQQTNLLTHVKYKGDYNTPLPALNVMYHVTDSWNLYANTEGSFGSVQYSQMPNRVTGGEVKPEKARTWEIGTRYDNGNLSAEIGAFLINFNNQYDSNQTTDTVIARGKTRHQGIEASVNYALDGLSPVLAGFDVYATYAYVDATIREEGPNKGNRVPFSSKNKGSIGVGYTEGQWKANLDTTFQSNQFADNANTRAESADGSNGLIPGYMVFNSRVGYDFGPQLSDLNVAVGVKNILNHEYYTRSFDDNNKGKYVGEPRTLYVQTSVAF